MGLQVYEGGACLGLACWGGPAKRCITSDRALANFTAANATFV